MKAFIFDPLWDHLITENLTHKLALSGLEVLVVKEAAPLSRCQALMTGAEERLLCVNPDYVGWKLRAEDYQDIPGLKAILGAATSFNWIDSSIARARDIPICNIRNFSTEAVAEWAIGMLFNLARQVPRLIKSGFPLDFDKDFMRYRGVELHGRRAGIVGLGHIGDSIAKRCAGLGMEVCYWSRSARSERYAYVSLETLFAESDVVVVALANNDETKGLITSSLLQSLRRSSIFISVVHGLFDEQMLLSMVEKGELFGYGFEAKPQAFGEYEGNVWAAPAYAWATDRSMENSLSRWIDAMIDAAAYRYPNRVA